MAGKQLTNPMGAFGETDLTTELYCETAPFQTSAVVTAGRVVAIGTDGTVAHAATNGVAALCVGIVDSNRGVNTAFSTLVIIEGYASGFADGATTAGAVLIRSTTTAGYVMASATPGVGEAIGVSMAASASGRVDMWVSKGA